MVSRSGLLLSAVLFLSFGFLLIGVLSVPVTKQLTICTYRGVKYGIWGYCKTSTGECSKISVGYNVSLDSASSRGFRLPSSARTSLSKLLIVHLVACGCTFILFVMSLFAQCSNSKYLIALLVLSLPCFLVTLLAFLVEILLFVNHMSFPGWFTLAAVVLNAVAIPVLCLMRRSKLERQLRDEQADEFADESLGYVHDRDDKQLLKHPGGSTTDTSNGFPAQRAFSHNYAPSEGSHQGTWHSADQGSHHSASERRGMRPDQRQAYQPSQLSQGSRPTQLRPGHQNPPPQLTSGQREPVARPWAKTPDDLRQPRYERAGHGAGAMPAGSVPAGAIPAGAVPAGTYVDGVDDARSSFGPNVVAIPRIRDSDEEYNTDRQPRARTAPHATPTVHDAPRASEASQAAVMSYIDAAPGLTVAGKPLPDVPNYSRLTVSPPRMKQAVSSQPGGAMQSRDYSHDDYDDYSQGGKWYGQGSSRGRAQFSQGNEHLQPPSTAPLVPAGSRSRPPPLALSQGNVPPGPVQAPGPRSPFDPAAAYRDALPDRVSMATLDTDAPTPTGGMPTIAQIAASDRTPLERYMEHLPQGYGGYQEAPFNQYPYEPHPASPVESEGSHYTSISQRRPTGPSPRRNAPSHSEFALQNNPDFSVGARPRRGRAPQVNRF